MKYQITCDNCSSKFIVEAEEGATIECNCPHCKGIMEITLPLVSIGETYVPYEEVPNEKTYVATEEDDSRTSKWLWGLVGLLLILAIGIGAYFGLHSSEPEEPLLPQTTVSDTIPYEQPMIEEPQPVVPDTVETAPRKAPKQEVAPEEKEQEQLTDSIQE